MDDIEIARIKIFIRICFEVEEILKITWTQKKVLLKIVELWGHQSAPPTVTEIAKSVHGTSESSVYRHLKPLIKKGLIKVNSSREDNRVKFMEPTPRLLKILSTNILF